MRTHIKTNRAPHIPDPRQVKRLLNLASRLNALTLFEDWTVLNVHIKEMNLLVPVGDLAVFVDPEDGVFDAPLSLQRSLRQRALGLRGFMNADVDWQFFTAGFLLETLHKLTFLYGFT